MRPQKSKQILLITALFSLLFYFVLPGIAKENILQLLEKEFQKVVTAARPAVVKVVATQVMPTPQFDPANKTLRITRQNIGSGIVIDTAGHVVTTTFDMDANKIEVVFSDGKVSPAKLIGVDKLMELAVLQAEHKPTIQVKQGNSSKIDTGSWVVTIGSSYGKSPIVSFGIVSGWDTLPDHLCSKLIKINAPVTPGNSGGAVVNTAGEIVGMILAVLTEPNPLDSLIDSILSEGINGDITQLLMHPSLQPQNNQEITFAIPIETVKSVATEIIKHGKVTRGWLGIHIEVGELGINVTQVIKGGPADKVGISPEDIILEFNNAPVQTYGELLRCVGGTAPNTEIRLKIHRDGRDRHYTVKLGKTP